VDSLRVDGKPFAEVVGPKAVHPDWRLAADDRTAYLQLLNDLRMFQIDLGGPAGKPVSARSLGKRIEGKHPDSRGSISLGPDGRVYSAVRIDNETGFGTGYLHHLVRYNPHTKQMADLGVIAVKDPNFFDFQGPQAKNPDGSLRPRHGFHTLPDGTLTPLRVIMALIVARDGTLYATTIYPFTLLRIPAVQEHGPVQSRAAACTPQRPDEGLDLPVVNVHQADDRGPACRAESAALSSGLPGSHPRSASSGDTPSCWSRRHYSARAGLESG
jgi:hypothetical protein